MKGWVWIVIGGYLEIGACIHMQAVSRDFYNCTVPHRMCLSKLVVRNYVFTFPLSKRFAKSMMMLDGNAQEACIVENPCLDVLQAKSVVFKKALILFKEGSPVVA